MGASGGVKERIKEARGGEKERQLGKRGLGRKN